MGNLPLGETRPLQLAVLPSSSITVSHLTHSRPVAAAAADSRYRLKTMTSAIAAFHFITDIPCVRSTDQSRGHDALIGLLDC